MSIEAGRAYFRQFGMEDRVQEFTVSSATVDLAAKALGVEGARIAKTLSFKTADGCMLILAAGDARIDNHKFKEKFHMKAKMLSADEVLELVGHPVGGVCPFAEISSLTQQLRQHQIELRKQQQNKSSNSVDELTGADYDDTEKNKGSKRQVGGISQGKMSAMISADSAMKQAQVQGSVATQINGKAGVLESEIAMDKGRGSSTEKKEQELADLQGKAQQAAQAQMSSLADAKESISKAGESDNETDRSADGKKTEHDSEKVKEDGTQDSSEPDSQNIYKKIDIRL